MGRVRADIRINGQDCWTLFDSGAERTYVVKELAQSLNRVPLQRSFPARIGGRTHTITQHCDFGAKVSGKYVCVHAFVVERLGMDRKAKRPIEILFGALAMQEWGIELDLKHECLDMSAYPEEWIEF